MLTTVLDLLGVACLSLFAFAVWAPLCLAVVGVAALATSYRLTTARKVPNA